MDSGGSETLAVSGVSSEAGDLRVYDRRLRVDEYRADVNGAVSIADRYLGGESRYREHENEMTRLADGARLTAPRDSQADATTWATLETYASCNRRVAQAPA
jgi:hypothetical protein